MMVADMMFIVYLVLIALGIWGLYKMVQMSDKAKEERNEEAPYKLETPGSVAVSGFGDAPVKHELRTIEFDTNTPPKRKYTKRSKYWTDKRKKAAARKAKKKTRKSK